MNTKTTCEEALQILMNKTKHYSKSDRVYTTGNDENGYGAITANYKLNDPKYTYVGTLRDIRRFMREAKRNFKIITIYDRIYNKLIRLIPNLENMKVGDHQISKADGFMNLSLNIINEEQEEQRQAKIISLTHYYKQNGDLVPDPDMMIRVYCQNKMAEALTYQDFFGFQAVYQTPTTFYPDLKTELNSFLNYWLNNCIQQGHGFSDNKKTNSEGY